MGRWHEYVNTTELRKAIEVLKPDNELFEIRIIPSGRQKPLSGYFKSYDTLIKAFESVDLRDTNVYITLNRLKSACFSRQQRNTFKAGMNTTTDTDIERREWLFIDIDPIRMAGVSSTAEELAAARNTARDVHDYLKAIGFSEPIAATSGNGWHLLYRIDLPNDEPSKQLVEKSLKTLSLLFDNEIVKIDTVNANASRICKLYGTMAQKGSSTEERPHRMSKLIKSESQVTNEEYLKKLVADIGDDQDRQQQTGQRYENFDLLEFMSEHNLKTIREQDSDDCKIYFLEECPFDHSHQNGDSRIFHYRNGAIAFKCHHNSCSRYHWQDVRRMFDPTAYDHYDDGHIDDASSEYLANRKKKQESDYVELTGDQELNDEPLFYTAKMIIDLPEEKEEFILTGCQEIDKKLRGLKKGSISVLSGNRASAKSTWLNQVVLNAIQNKNSVVMYSGELEKKTVFKWLFLQAAGNENLESRDTPGVFYTPKDVKKKIALWMSEYLRLYNNRYGNNFQTMQKILMKEIRDSKADLVILDNLMTLDIREMNPADKYSAQSAFVQYLKRMAMQTNTHIIFVAHPRKTVGFLRLEDVAGSGDIVNAVDNAFIIHRRNKDFEDRYKEFSKKFLPECDNVIEICKDRENGTQDYFIPLWYDQKSKRLKNSQDDYIVYDWEADENRQFDFKDLPDDIENPFSKVIDYEESEN